ncbi:hypothetical protein CGBL_0108250 [Corynebacterium glutamicum]|nr:hypothetical protein CGBL_0108250 [Corynebacterium glutamicum]
MKFYEISRFRRRRSRSERPPQIPKRSSCSRANSRHSSRTGQPWQIRLASRVEPPFSGKNASGSVCAHSACSCHSCSTAPNRSSKVISSAVRVWPAFNFADTSPAESSITRPPLTFKATLSLFSSGMLPPSRFGKFFLLPSDYTRAGISPSTVEEKISQTSAG